MSTTLPHGIIQINEGNISWYGDITANWQLIDSKIGEYDAAVASIPAPANNGRLTINYDGTTIAMFGANDAGNVTADIPAPGDGTLTIQQNGVNVQTFTANQATAATANIQCVDLTNNQTVAGNKKFTGTTTAHDVIPSATDTYNFGSSSYQWNNAYIKSLTINGVVCGDILTHNASEFVGVTGNQTIAGVKTFASNMVIQGGKKVVCNVDNSLIEFDGGTTWGKGGSIVLGGQDRSSYPNSVLIVSKSDTNTDILQYQNGELKPLSNNTNNSSLGTSTNKWESVYSNTYYLGNTAFGNIVTHNASEFVRVSDLTSVLPIGSYIQFAGSQAPDGFLVCNGGEISRTTYSALFAVIGTTYGSGDGSTTFNLPNLTDKFLQGSTTSGTVKDAGLPNIIGYIHSPAHSGSERLDAFKVDNLDSGTYAGGGDHFWNWSFSASRSSSIYGNSTTVQPPALTCLICIKY